MHYAFLIKDAIIMLNTSLLQSVKTIYDLSNMREIRNMRKLYIIHYDSLTENVHNNIHHRFYHNVHNKLYHNVSLSISFVMFTSIKTPLYHNR